MTETNALHTGLGQHEMDEQLSKMYQAVYEAQTHDDCKRAYQQWAPLYEYSEVEKNKWKAPQMVARLLCRYVESGNAELGGLATPTSNGPILDVGAGTGLVGVTLRELLPKRTIIAYDLSPDMLKIAEEKKVYDSLIEGAAEDLLKPDGPLQQTLGSGVRFAGITCVGSINHGHIPVEAIDWFVELLEDHGYCAFSFRTQILNSSAHEFLWKGATQGKWRIAELYTTRNACADDLHTHVCLQKLSSDERDELRKLI
ncbi:hypothetical protein FisN_21Hh200 [Fistulifera solaris]|uniref:Methyltransferase domain-containing protein n=1 Tax=Fistulifera solaris TaxID=1519565 RepID=A0A1Z5JRU2_FISSO|nr:hypothetical protein FisN_21Hh200 [Fistulifera solaris]|eukprot:GAX16753.1 hypothetical protein FisN_21Hh200 [Fistulifera solaris]